MAHILVHHKVEDYATFKAAFDGHAAFRSQNGSRGGKVFRSAGNPNELFILLQWDSLENAQKFAQTDNLKQAMQSAGVVGMPEVYFVEEVAAPSV